MNTRRRLEMLATASLSQEDCPSSDELADYVLGTLHGTKQLQIAAHIRSCLMCLYDVELIKPLPSPVRMTIARLASLPFVGASLRSAARDQQQSDIRQYVAADLNVNLTIAPPLDERWHLTGQITHIGAPKGDCQVILRRSGRRRAIAVSDSGGFFSFADLRAGHYTIEVMHEQIRVQIRDIALTLGDT